MASWSYFLFVYLLGGLTFLPLALAAVFLHAYLTFPYREDVAPAKQTEPDPDDIVQPGDDVDTIQSARKLLKDEAKPRVTPHEPDVAAGYFAVCREYTPMGINAKPIERATPAGTTTVAAPSQSVYQTMYRTLFDRKQAAGPLDHNNSTSQRPKKAGNVFYVVLRHGHLMLFDDDEQLEVRHVISLAHHDISVYSGGDKTPEGELWIKRNAICLSRKTDGAELAPDTQISKPFYLFSENCSAKEDFYFALLRNQEQTFTSEKAAPTPVQFEVKNIISLVQKLHSSEEHLQTRWLNAMIGRIFLGIYKTADVEAFIRAKLTKKISRVKRPNFLSNITIRNIDTGESAPYFTNPRLKDLTVEGECCVESDVKYTGNFRIEVAATARIDLGSRFKAREVNLVLAVVLRKLEGHVFFKIKPPPSNRIWFSFQHMPKMEMTVEPIISSRQITYTVILRQIENRIKEVLAETLVLPFWDDVPFFDTAHKNWRGGIWAGDDAVLHPTTAENSAAQGGDVEDVDHYEEAGEPSPDLPPVEKSHTVPVIETSGTTGLFGRRLNGKASPVSKAATSALSLENIKPISLGRQGRAGSFASPSAPTAATDAAHADVFKPSTTPPNESPAVSAMSNLSAKVQSQASIAESTSSRPVAGSHPPSYSSTSSKEATETEHSDNNQTPKSQAPRRNTQSSTGSSILEDQPPHSPASTKSTTKTRGFFLRREPSQTSMRTSSPGGNHNHHQHANANADPSSPKRSNTLAAMSNAAATAKRWGMGGINALQRRGGGASDEKHGGAGDGDGGDHEVDEDGRIDLSKPMGGGRPLPPPGTPLPMPDRRRGKITPIPVPPRRKAVPSPSTSGSSLHHHQTGGGGGDHQHKIERRPVPPPPLPKRRHVLEDRDGGGGGSGGGGGGGDVDVLVVEAPLDDEPTTPSGEDDAAQAQHWAAGLEDGGEVVDKAHREGEEGGGVSPALMMLPVAVADSGSGSGSGSSRRSGGQTPLGGEVDDGVASARAAYAETLAAAAAAIAPAEDDDDDDDDISAWMEQDDGEPAEDDTRDPAGQQAAAAVKTS